MPDTAIELKNVIKNFPGRRGETPVRAVDDVHLQIMDGEFFALLGPSGCGKTTTLRMIAGFEDTSSGEILLRGKPVQNVPSFHRPVNTVFQDYALFPHMTALQNVMFGLEMEGVNKAEATERAHKALELVQLPHAANRKPSALSGGQQQRVALARALVKDPAVLLLDEPLGALDLKLRKDMQYELKAMQQRLGITFIYVTHDQEEAMTMADRIAVMNHGKVLQVGTPEEIYESPSERFVADFIGETNFINGTLLQGEGEHGVVEISAGIQLRGILPKESLSPNQQVSVAIRPEKIGIFPTEGEYKRVEGGALPAQEFRDLLQGKANTSVIAGEVFEAFYIGTDTRYGVKLTDNVMVVARVQNFGHRFDTIYKPGEKVCLYWDIENVRVLSH
jgi:spermidine/putrescine transport system ATP-binding protein